MPVAAHRGGEAPRVVELLVAVELAFDAVRTPWAMAIVLAQEWRKDLEAVVGDNARGRSDRLGVLHRHWRRRRTDCREPAIVPGDIGTCRPVGT
jgi:hypothetical protein